jgi:hydroxymethylpyrimidine/phosphomethylpyrimidine kinase
VGRYHRFTSASAFVFVKVPENTMIMCDHRQHEFGTKKSAQNGDVQGVSSPGERPLTAREQEGTICVMEPAAPLRTLLAVGGLDPSGGAGLIVDGHAARSLGLHAAAVATLLTVQDGLAFTGARAVDPGLVRDGMTAVLESQDVGAVKTGALGVAGNVAVVAELAERDGFPPLVVDPVIGSTSGGELLDSGGVRRLCEGLLPVAALVTPNAREAAVLAGVDVDDAEGAVRAGERLVELGARAALVKGGHLAGEQVTDVLVAAGESVVTFSVPRRDHVDVRGTGCALGSLIAGRLALGFQLGEAVMGARNDLQVAIRSARSVGPGPPVLVFG